MAEFERFLDVELKLTIDGTETSVPKGQVESIHLELHSWGFDAEVAFWLSSQRAADALFATFKTKKLIEAKLKISPPQDDGSAAPDDETVKVTGYVTTKSVREQTIKAATDLPVKFRRYVIRFADAARVLWKQHRPNDLLVDSNLQALIDAHKGDKITIDCSAWDVTQTQHPIHFVGLGADPNGASFYDFVMWFVDTQNGVLAYDAAKDSYKLTSTKATEGGTGKLQPIEIVDYHIDFPATSRAKVNVQNSYAEGPKTDEIANDEAATGIRHDFLTRTQISQEGTDRVTLETARSGNVREPEVAVEFAKWPTTGFLPGALVDFSHADWGTSVFPSGNTYRSRELVLDVKTPVDAVRLETGTAMQGARVSLDVRFELEAEKYVALPAYVTPTWPASVEGHVVSEQGDDDAETWQFYTDSNTSVDQYKVKIPLWADKIVVAPFDPINFTSHYFFPLLKKERVLVALSFRSARIERTLDWRAGARQTQDSLGNYILMGHKEADNKTFIGHTYSGDLPTLTVKRIKDKDTETLEIKDGNIRLHTEETQ